MKGLEKNCPIVTHENKRSRPRGKLDFRKAAGLGKEIWEDIDVDAYVRKERDEWI